MRSAKETSCFPYTDPTICYLEVNHYGWVTHLHHEEDRREAYFHAKRGESRIYAVWPGKTRSDPFFIDDLDIFAEKLHLLDSYIRRRDCPCINAK